MTTKEHLRKRPSWELNNMVLALSMCPFLNTEEEEERLKLAKEVLAERRDVGGERSKGNSAGGRA